MRRMEESLASFVLSARKLKEHERCPEEAEELFGKTEESLEQLRKNVSRYMPLTDENKEPSVFLNNILRKYQNLYDKFAEIGREFDEHVHSISSLDTFFSSAELAVKLKEILRILKVYNDVWEEILPMIVPNKSRKVKELNLRHDSTSSSDSAMDLLESEDCGELFYLLGKSHFEGKIVDGKFTRDYILSASYFVRALEEGHFESAFFVGELFYFGRGLPISSVHTRRAARKARNFTDGRCFTGGICLLIRRKGSRS